MSKKNKKVEVKMNPLLNKSKVRDTVSGIVFSSEEWVEIDSDIWERLKENRYNQGGERISVLISNEEEPDDKLTEEDNESVDEVVEDFFIAEEE
jgi:hypothetical protein